jgi:hypothetical protein
MMVALDNPSGCVRFALDNPSGRVRFALDNSSGRVRFVEEGTSCCGADPVGIVHLDIIALHLDINKEMFNLQPQI